MGTLSVTGARSGGVTGASAAAGRMPPPGAASRSAPGLLPSNEPPGLAGPGCCKSRAGCGAGGFPHPTARPALDRGTSAIWQPGHPVPVPVVVLLGPGWGKWVSGEDGFLAPPTLAGTLPWMPPPCPSPPAPWGLSNPREHFTCVHLAPASPNQTCQPPLPAWWHPQPYIPPYGLGGRSVLWLQHPRES